MDDYNNKHMNRRDAAEYIHDPSNPSRKPRSNHDNPPSTRNGQAPPNILNNDPRHMHHMDDPRDNKRKESGGGNRGIPLSQMKLKNENVMTAILSLIKDLGEIELELVKREVEGRLGMLYEGDLKDIDDYY
jgi:hypothetical protein